MNMFVFVLPPRDATQPPHRSAAVGGLRCCRCHCAAPPPPPAPAAAPLTSEITKEEAMRRCAPSPGQQHPPASVSGDDAMSPHREKEGGTRPPLPSVSALLASLGKPLPLPTTTSSRAAGGGGGGFGLEGQLIPTGKHVLRGFRRLPVMGHPSSGRYYCYDRLTHHGDPHHFLTDIEVFQLDLPDMRRA